MKRLWLLSACLLFSACTAGLFSRYPETTTVTVPPMQVGTDASPLTTFQVGYDGARASVAPIKKDRAKLIYDDLYAAKWSANAGLYQPLYASALNAALGKQCTITQAFARPDWFGFDFAYTCP
jgi:hypothetical protein